MGDSFGLENVLWFANNKDDAYEEPTIKRSRSHNYVSKEVISVRENVGVTEVATSVTPTFSLTLITSFET